MRTILTIFSLLILFGTTAAAAPVTAEKKAQAKLHYEDGLRKYDMGKYDEASEEFQRAFELTGEPVILYNVAQSFRLGQKYDKALLFYKSYLRRQPEAPNRAEVERRIAEMTEMVDRQRAASEAPPTGVLPSDREKLSDKPADTAKETSPPPTTTTTAAPVEEHDYRKLRIPGIAILAVGVAGLALGGAMAALASSSQSTIEGARHGEFTPSLRDTESAGNTYQAAGIACFVVGGAAAATGAVLMGLGYGKKSRTVTSLRLAPMLAPGLAGLAVGGTL